MKKRVLSALLALCLTLSLAGAAFAENEPSGDSSSAVSQAVSSVESEPQTQNETVFSDSASGEDQTTAKTESTPAPTETPAASDVVEEEPESTPEPEAATEPDTTPAPTEDPVADVTENEESDGSVEYTAALETDGETMNVIVIAPEGAFAEDVQPKLSVTMLTAEDELNAVAGELDTAEVQYDGFAALDITFTDEATGEEVEPVKSVTVRIELPQTIVDSGIDLTTLAVQHLEEDENGNVQKVTEVATLDNGITLSEEASAAVNEAAGVAPVNDMPAEEATAGDATETPAAVAEFSVDGFSSFTITWNSSNGITVYLVDRNGNELSGTVDFDDLNNVYKPNDFKDKYIANQWVSIEELASTWASQTEGYTYVAAYVGRNFGSSVNFYWLRCNTEKGWFGGENFSEWRYATSLQAPSAEKGGYTLYTYGSYHQNIYLVYDEISEPVPNPELTITDQVSTDGTFTATYTGEAEGTYYVWQQNVDSAWVDITRLKMNGDQYNLSENGETFNVVLDVVNNVNDAGGGWYRVKVYKNKEAYQSGEESIATSQAYQLQYYDELQNGSFSTPDVDALSGGNKSNYQYPVGTEGLVWKTTGEDQQIEIVNATNDLSDGKSDYNNQNGAATNDNDQYAELNAERAGALYQDVITVPGTTLNWQLYHRAREAGGKDTMYLLIAPTNKVSNITTQSDLENLINKIKADTETYSEQGYYLYTISDNNQQWVLYNSMKADASPYNVPDGQYLTRFFFVAGETASGNNTQGNLLDEVSFTTGLLPAEPGTANLEIKKVVSGVADLPSNYSVTVCVENNENQTVELTAFSKQTDGTYIATGSVTGISVPANGSVSLTVKEENPPAISGYNGPTCSVQVGQNSASYDSYETRITLRETETGRVTFTNSYTPSTGSLTIAKKVSDNVSNLVSDENYIFTVTPKDGQQVEWTNVTAKDEDEAPVDVESNGSGSASVTLTGTGSVTLSNMPSGKYQISETEPEDLDGYYYVGNSLENGSEVTVPAGNTGHIDVTNTYAAYMSLTITKKVTGAMGSNDDWFDFTIGGANNAEYEPVSDQIPDEDSTADFRLNNDSTITLSKLKPNDTVIISETTSNGYTAKGITIQTGSVLNDSNLSDKTSTSVTITIPKSDQTDLGTVIFTNEREAVAPTGLEDNQTKPFGLMVGVAVMAGLALAGGAVVRRRRRWME